MRMGRKLHKKDFNDENSGGLAQLLKERGNNWTGFEMGFVNTMYSNI